MQMIGTPVSGFYSLVTVDMMVDCIDSSPSSEFMEVGDGDEVGGGVCPLSLLCSHFSSL